ncbi:MAG TPA: hypothetical protein VFZ76_10050 [Anaerolineales bacterium]
MKNEKQNSSHLADPADEPPAQIYEICVKGCMNEGFWSDWFGDMEFTIDPDQEKTILRGDIADQAELYGLLSRLRNKGLTLISVQQIRQNTNREGE